MADLKDPALPPGAIVATHEEEKSLEEGQVRRNDGAVLNSAAKNPWYLLATVIGEQEANSSFQLGYDTHLKNRRYWNGWMCKDMSDNDRVALAKKMEVDTDELGPLSDEEENILNNRFASSLSDIKDEKKLPNPLSPVDMSTVHFSKVLSLSKYYFPRPISLAFSYFSEPADFRSARFEGLVDFKGAHFNRSASFMSGYFSGSAGFQSTVFLWGATFERAHFATDAMFGASRFDRFAGFQSAVFSGYAGFKAAQFEGPADFSNGLFASKTTFANAKFDTQVPKFFHREMHQDTSFSDDPDFWPSAAKENAEDGKRAYTRLRQIAAEIYDPDLEHFFLRQEMRCKERIEIGKKSWFNAGFFKLFRWVADSGISVDRPFWLMVCVWAFGTGCAAGYFDSGVEAVLSADIQDNRYWSAAGISFGNLFGFLGINRLYFADVLRAAPDGLQFVAGLQTVLGVVLLFFFGLGLRNRFRLK